MNRLAAGLHQKPAHAVDEVRVTIDRVLLAVQPGLRVSHGIDETAALKRNRIRDLDAGELRDLEQQLVGSGNAQWVMESRRFLALGSDVIEGFVGAIFL